MAGQCTVIVGQLLVGIDICALTILRVALSVARLVRSVHFRFDPSASVLCPLCVCACVRACVCVLSLLKVCMLVVAACI